MPVISPRQPFWSEGLLLCPQHLQAQDDYHEARVAQLLGALHPLTWGLGECTLDEAALSRGEIAIERMQGILPDGTPLAWGPGDGRPPAPRSLTDRELERGTRILIKVALPCRRSGTANIDTHGASERPRRFTVDTKVAEDLADEHPPRTIAVLTPAPLILVGDESDQGMSALPVLALRRRSDGGFIRDDTFIPPSLRIDAVPGLRERLQRLLGSATTRRRALQRELPRCGSRIDYRPSELTHHLMVHTLGRAIPRLRGLIDGPSGSPLAAHAAIAELAGELLSFLAEGDPATLPLYNHVDLASSLLPLIELTIRLIELPLTEELLTIPLRPRGSGLFASERLDIELQRAQAVFLVIEGQADLRGYAAAAPDLVKIAARRRIEAIIRSNSRGAPVQPTTRPPLAPPSEKEAIYFVVDTQDPHWQEILFHRELAIHLSSPLDLQGLELRLLALPSASSTEIVTDGLAPSNRAPSV